MGKEHRHLPRLHASAYRGHAAVHWIHTIEDRKTGWLGDAFHAAFREILLHTLARYRLCCPVYCLMPDHAHLLWMGWHPDANQPNASKFLRRHMNVALEAAQHGTRLQHQPYDHVLREEERRPGAFEIVAQYIAANPVRAGLAAETGIAAYPYAGCVVPGYPELRLGDAGLWASFWRIYAFLRDAPERDGCAPTDLIP